MCDHKVCLKSVSLYFFFIFWYQMFDQKHLIGTNRLVLGRCLCMCSVCVCVFLDFDLIKHFNLIFCCFACSHYAMHVGSGAEKREGHLWE